MEIKFIGQGYNLEANTSVAEELITAFSDEAFNTFQCLVAFASFGGISALTPHVESSKNHITTFRIVVGIDHEVTSKEALEELLVWNIDAFVYHSTSRILPKPIFHPKIYLFKGEEKIQVIVGSNNFTEYGLGRNIEASVSIIYNITEVEDNHLLMQVESYFENLLNGTDFNLEKITPELIERLHNTGELPSDERRKERFNNSPLTNLVDNEGRERLKDIFKSTPMQNLPFGFTPKRRKIRKHIENQPILNDIQFIDDNNNWSGNSVNPVLVAEVGRGTRWKQVNFPILMFQNFFGATAGDNQYHINLRHITSTGEIEEIEDRQAYSCESEL